MHFAHQRARRVHNAQAPRVGLTLHRGGHAVRGEHDRNAGFGGGIRNLIEFLDEHGATPGELFDDMLVVHDLPAHIHRRQAIRTGPGSAQNRVDRLDGAVHAGAESAWIRQHNAFRHDVLSQFAPNSRPRRSPCASGAL